MESALALLPPDQKEPPLKLAQRHAPKTNKPAFWSSKIHGIPRNYAPKKPSTAIDIRRPEKGRFKGGTAASVHKPRNKNTLQLQKTDALTRKRVEQVTEQLRRKVITEYTPFHEKESAILMRTFKAFDVENRRTISPAAFQKVLDIFDIETDSKLVNAIFDKYGCDMQGRLPYDVFVRALFTSNYRLLAWNSIQQGVPFTSTGNALQRREEDAFSGKIQQGNKRCITGLYTPNDWDGKSTLARSRRQPDSHLELERVYGYSGNTKVSNLKIDPQSSWLAPNLFFASTGEGVYFTAAVGVVLSYDDDPTKTTKQESGGITSKPAKHSAKPAESAADLKQRFFQSHDDDVLCIALDESRNYVATGQKAPAKLAKGVQCSATVSVWDVHSMQELMELEHKEIEKKEDTPGSGRMAGVQAVCFNETGDLLITVCCNTYHTLHVWEWRKKQLIFHQNTRQATPPSVWGVKWNPVELTDDDYRPPQTASNDKDTVVYNREKYCDFVTFGVKHIYFWEAHDPINTVKDGSDNATRKKKAWSALPGHFGQETEGKGKDGKPLAKFPIQDVMCVEFLQNCGWILSGMASGDIYLWKVNKWSDGLTHNEVLTRRQDKDRTTIFDPVKIEVVLKFDWKISPSSKFVRPHKHNLMALKLRANGKELYSAGGEGEIKVWKVAEKPNDQEPQGALQPLGGFEIRSPGRHGGKPIIKALDTEPGSDDIVIGTDKCDIWKVTLKRSGAGFQLKEASKKRGKENEKTIDTSSIILVKGHSDEVCGLDAHPTLEGLFATACKSDRVYLWNSQTGQELALGEVSIPTSSNQACACAFSADGKRLAVGTDDGAVAVFDIDKFQGGTLKPLSNGKGGDKGTLPLHTRAHRISEMKYSPNNKMLAVAGHDTKIEIFNTANDSYVKIAVCGGHSATVSHMDWSIDCKVLQSSCNARELLYWDVWWGYEDTNGDEYQPGRRIGRQCIDDQRDTQWATWSCNIGFEVMGIYPDDYNTDDINMTARSRDGRFLAAADDRGGVMLYNHPAVVEDGPHFWYSGHSSHVMNVKWLKVTENEEPVLVSAGGADRAIFQWRLIEDRKPDPEKKIDIAAPAPALKDETSASSKSAQLRSASFMQQQAELEKQKSTIKKQDEEIKALMSRLALLEQVKENKKS